MGVVSGFILTVAGSVLSDVIKGLVTGQKKTTQMVEIEREVARQLQERTRIQQEQYAQVTRDVINEINILLTRDPNLVISDGIVELKNPVKKSLWPNKRSGYIEQEVKTQLDQLDKIVAQRRAELQLALPPDQETSSKDIADQESKKINTRIEWRRVNKKEEKDLAAKELLEMQDKIRRRRAGEIVKDED